MMSVDSTTTYLIAAILVVAAFAIALTVTLRGGRARRRKNREDPYVAGLRLLLDGDRTGAYASLQKSIKGGKAPPWKSGYRQAQKAAEPQKKWWAVWTHEDRGDDVVHMPAELWIEMVRELKRSGTW